MATRSSPRISRPVSSDPYDINEDAEIIKESDEEKRLRRESQLRKKEEAMEKAARQSVAFKMEPYSAVADDGEIEADGNLVVTASGEFLCATCPRSFRSIVGRQRHMLKCKSIVPEGSCPCCGEDDNTCHSEGDYVCAECDGLFPTEAALTRHLDILHRGRASFSCAVCPRIFFDKELLVKHLTTHSDQKPWMCTKCNAVFTRKYHLDRHFRQSGCDGTKKANDNICQVCGRAFSRKDNLREHLRAHAGINKRLTVYRCEFCDAVISGLSAYNKHKKDLHVGNKPYKCHYCPMRFIVSGAMKKHMRTHTGEKPYQCRECFRRFAAKETLNRHMKTHTEERPYECPHCEKKFIQHVQLRSHIFYHTGVPDFRCDSCPQAFRQKQQLTEHVRIVHEGYEPMCCSHCPKTFLSKRQLIKHVLIHAGIKEFECEKCHKTFAQRAYLRVHLLTHTREAPRACNYCNRAFIRQDCLLRHMRVKHREKLHEILIEAERKKVQLQLISMSKKEKTMESEPAQTLADRLPMSVADLLNILVDEETLRGFGAPDAPIDELLKLVIKRCGHTPVENPELSRLDILRENAKLLFTVVIDDAGVKALLNNQSVDEVIQHVLELVKSGPGEILC